MYRERGQEELTHEENMKYHTNDPTHFWSESQPLEGYGNLTHPCAQNDKLVNDCYDGLLCEETNKFDGALITRDPHTLVFYDMSFLREAFEVCCELVSLWHVLCPRMLRRLFRDYHLACFDIECLCALINESLSMPLIDDSSCLLESQNRLTFEVDSVLSDLECSKSKIEDKNEVILFYSINGDDVEYFPQNSFHAKVDFIFPLDSFFPFKQPMIKETLMIHATLIAICLERLFMVLTWANICLIAYSFACLCRRRTIGPISQTFDTYD